MHMTADVVIVELALQGTHKGPLQTAYGTTPPTGKRMDAPCCDIFWMVNGKVKQFNCYNEASTMLAQLGVLSNLQAALVS